MQRRRISPASRAQLWGRLLKAAKDYHQHPADHGMLTIIANDAGLTKASVSEWKSGKTYPSDATLRKLADLYRVSTEALEGVEEASGAYGPPNEALQRAADITELIVTELLPNGTSQQVLGVMRRAHQLLAEGKTDDQVRSTLLLEVSAQKKNGV